MKPPRKRISPRQREMLARVLAARPRGFDLPPCSHLPVYGPEQRQQDGAARTLRNLESRGLVRRWGGWRLTKPGLALARVLVL